MMAHQELGIMRDLLAILYSASVDQCTYSTTVTIFGASYDTQ